MPRRLRLIERTRVLSGAHRDRGRSALRILAPTREHRHIAWRLAFLLCLTFWTCIGIAVGTIIRSAP